MENGIVNVQIKGLDRLTKALKKYPKISAPIFERGLNATAAAFAKQTLKDDPVPWRTGMLTQTFEFVPATEARLIATWKPTREYAPYVEFGTNRMMARPFMRKIIDKARPEIDELMSRSMDLVTKAIANA